MKGILDFIKNWVLIIALLIGCLGHGFLIRYADKTIYLIFFMLFFTFCRIDPSQLKFRRVHAVFLALQLVAAVGLYYLCAGLGNTDLAETLMMCVLAPTAAASSVVTMKLGGDIASTTTYVLISSLAAAVAVPLWFPLINPAMHDVPFWIAFWSILRKVLPILAGPFLLALLLKYITPKFHDRLAQCHEVSFYLWALCLVFASSQMIDAVEKSHVGTRLAVWLVLLSVLACLLQFWLGKRLGRHYGDSVSGGQSLGQKNIVLAIWIAGVFLARESGQTPMAVVGLGAYIICQNLVNSWQLYRKRLKDKESNGGSMEMVP